jgi:hypothetical protein
MDSNLKPYPGSSEWQAPEDFGWLPLKLPTKLNVDSTKLVLEFSQALALKLLNAQEKYGYTDNWKRPDWMDECRQELRNHIEKGDPLDVAAYSAFLWYHESLTNVKQPEDV